MRTVFNLTFIFIYRDIAARAKFFNKELLRLFDDFCNAPILVFRQLAGFHYPYLVAFAALVVFVVRLEFRGAGNGLFIQGVLALFNDGYNNRLVHFIGYHKPNSFLSERRSFHILLLYPFICLARITVFTLAISFLTRLIARGFSS